MSVPVAWVMGLLTALEPNAPWRPTYERTAEAIARVAEAEPLFEERGEERTAALLVAVAWYESRLKPTARSRDGQFLCLYQVHRRHLTVPAKALDDPELCTRTAVRLLRASLARCAKRPESERLAAFASGVCDKGITASRYRTFLASKLLRDHPMHQETGGGAARAR